MTHLISVIVPVYNEENTIGNVLDRLLRLHSGIEQEILVVNDGSTDKTEEISKLYKSFTLISHEKNMGKGVALATGMKHSRGDIITIQDADLEYFPEDIPRIVKPIIEDRRGRRIWIAFSWKIHWYVYVPPYWQHYSFARRKHNLP